MQDCQVKMNKKGQTTGLAIVSAIMILIIGFTVLNLIKPEIDNVRSANSGLDCSNSAISDATKLTCLAFDTSFAYFVIIILSVSGGLIISRFSV